MRELVPPTLAKALAEDNEGREERVVDPPPSCVVGVRGSLWSNGRLEWTLVEPYGDNFESDTEGDPIDPTSLISFK